MLLSTLTLASLAWAEPPAADAKGVEALVRRELVEPLKAKELKQSRFSRARLPPQVRRVRVLDDSPRHDSAGRAFFTFAIDARHGFEALEEDGEASWRKAAITGCAYPDTQEVFVKSGDRHRPAAFLLGKKVKAAEAQACQGEATAAAPGQAANAVAQAR